MLLRTTVSTHSYLAQEATTKNYTSITCGFPCIFSYAAPPSRVLWETHTPRSQGLSYSPLGFSSHKTILKLSTSHPWTKSSYLVQYPASLQEECTHYTYTRDTSDPIHGHKPQNRIQVCTNIQ